MPKKKELQLPTDVAINISKVDVYYTLVYAKKKELQLPTDVAINISKVDVYYTLVYAKKKKNCSYQLM